MKTKIISTLKKDLLIIELPKWYKSFNYQKPLLEVRGDEPNLAEFLSLGRYELLGAPDEIKEEDVRILVSDFDAFENSKYYYLHGFWKVIEKEIYWVNPWGDRMPIFVEASPSAFKFVEKEKERWKEAQEKTFDRNRTLIFVKN